MIYLIDQVIRIDIDLRNHLHVQPSSLCSNPLDEREASIKLFDCIRIRKD